MKGNLAIIGGFLLLILLRIGANFEGSKFYHVANCLVPGSVYRSIALDEPLGLQLEPNWELNAPGNYSDSFVLTKVYFFDPVKGVKGEKLFDFESPSFRSIQWDGNRVIIYGTSLAIDNEEVLLRNGIKEVVVSEKSRYEPSDGYLFLPRTSLGYYYAPSANSLWNNLVYLTFSKC
jgi:hypothetical protein